MENDRRGTLVFIRGFPAMDLDMNPDGERPTNADVATVRTTRRALAGIRGLCVLVACCGMIMWAGRVVWEYRDPELARSRTVQAAALAALESRDAAERVAGIRELERLHRGDSAIAVLRLTPLLGDSDPSVRGATADALGTVASQALRSENDPGAIRAAVAALIRSLKDTQPGVRTAAVRSLESISSMAMTVSVSPAAGLGGAGAKNAGPANSAAGAAGVDAEAVITALAETLRDQDASVRRAAILALAAAGSTGDPPKALATAFEDASAENRSVAVHTVVGFGRGLDSWIPALLRIAEHDHDRSVRDTCMYALGQVKPPAITPRSVAVLIASLRANDSRVRDAAAGLLGGLGTDAAPAIPSLLEMVKESNATDRHTALRRVFALRGDAAVRALGLIAPGTPAANEVISVLMAVLKGDLAPSRAAAIEALMRFESKAAVAIPTIRALSDDPDPQVRRAVESALRVLED
jgi:HEAT repeat protein